MSLSRTLLLAALFCGCRANTAPDPKPDPAPAPAQAEVPPASGSAPLDEAPAPPRVVAAPEPQVPRATRRQELRSHTARMPGWELSETGHYFVVTDLDDEERLDEFKEHAEAIRRRIRLDFPHPQADPVPVRSSPNVLRLIAEQGMYAEYGGSGHSRSYWSNLSEEAVVDVSGPRAGPNGSMGALQAALFFEYFDTTYERPPADPWFLMGNAQYYQYLTLEDGEWVDQPDPGRHVLLLERLESGKALSLRELLNLNRAEFNGSNDAHLSAHELQTHAWCLVRFLRDPAAAGPYAGLLDDYLAELLASRDPDRAYAAVLGALDWDAFESAFRAWVESGI